MLGLTLEKFCCVLGAFSIYYLEWLMRQRWFFLVIGALASTAGAQTAPDPAEVEMVVSSVKAAHPDFKALCQQGPDGVRRASMDAIRSLMSSGKLKGNPQAVGNEAGQQMGKECRGG